MGIPRLKFADNHRVTPVPEIAIKDRSTRSRPKAFEQIPSYHRDNLMTGPRLSRHLGRTVKKSSTALPVIPISPRKNCSYFVRSLLFFRSSALTGYVPDGPGSDDSKAEASGLFAGPEGKQDFVAVPRLYGQPARS